MVNDVNLEAHLLEMCRNPGQNRKSGKTHRVPVDGPTGTRALEVVLHLFTPVLLWSLVCEHHS